MTIGRLFAVFIALAASVVLAAAVIASASSPLFQQMSAPSNGVPEPFIPSGMQTPLLSFPVAPDETLTPSTDETGKKQPTMENPVNFAIERIPDSQVNPGYHEI
jgi:hypothetical protein